MSDRPLFENTDEQERIYAPQQLPEGSAGERDADLDERTSGADAPGVVVVPGAAGSSGAAGPAVGPGSGTVAGIGVLPEQPRTGNDSGETEGSTASQQP